MEQKIIVNWFVEKNPCPGLFYGTPAQDGFLIRLRTPGGCLNSTQGSAIALLLEKWNSTIQVTNRGNLQIRGIKQSPTLEEFTTLQKLGLASHNPNVDHLRNIMGSPTAGIDCQELIDTGPLIKELDHFIQNYPPIALLNSKFSIGIDGGGAVAIGTRSTMTWQHRYNEIQLSAYPLNYPTDSTSNVVFRVALGGDKELYETDLFIEPKKVITVVKALITVYVDYVRQNPSIKGKKPRMKHLLKDWGLEKYLQQVKCLSAQEIIGKGQQLSHLNLPLEGGDVKYLGIHPQKQRGLSYLGLSLKLGQLTATQLRGLVALSEHFGSSQLRLTPWQSVILPDISEKKVSELLLKLTCLGLSPFPKWESTIVACGGKPGCAKAATATHSHASYLIDYLNQRLPSHSPVNIHVTGCDKSCAQPSLAQITLLGTTFKQNGVIIEGYQVYVGDSQKFSATPLYEGEFSKIPSIVEQFLVSQASENLHE